MTDTLQIRQMTEDDLEKIIALDHAVFYDPWMRSAFESSLKSCLCYVLLSHERIEGYTIFSTIFDEGELLRIAVNPKARRKGFASALMEEMFRVGRERNIEHWFLEVRESNVGAIKLYEKFGFLMMGRRKGYYPAPNGREDAITMHAGRKS